MFHFCFRTLHLRDDIVTDGNCCKAILANAAVTEEGYFVAPQGNIPLIPRDSLLTGDEKRKQCFQICNRHTHICIEATQGYMVLKKCTCLVPVIQLFEMTHSLHNVLQLFERQCFLWPVVISEGSTNFVQYFKYGFSGELLRNNISKEWLLSMVINTDESIFPYHSSGFTTTSFIKGKSGR